MKKNKNFDVIDLFLKNKLSFQMSITFPGVEHANENILIRSSEEAGNEAIYRNKDYKEWMETFEELKQQLDLSWIDCVRDEPANGWVFIYLNSNSDSSIDLLRFDFQDDMYLERPSVRRDFVNYLISNNDDFIKIESFDIYNQCFYYINKKAIKSVTDASANGKISLIIQLSNRSICYIPDKNQSLDSISDLLKLIEK